MEVDKGCLRRTFWPWSVIRKWKQNREMEVYCVRIDKDEDDE